jgi:hypothetical protein
MGGRRKLVATLIVPLVLIAGCSRPSRSISRPLDLPPVETTAPVSAPPGGPSVSVPPAGTGGPSGPTGPSGPAPTVAGGSGTASAAAGSAAAVSAAAADLQAVQNQLDGLDGQLSAADQGMSSTEPDPAR